MPRSLFDLCDGDLHPDTEGQKCARLEDVRVEALQTLPEIAKFSVPADGGQQTSTVIVRDEETTLVSTATLTFVGLWVDAKPP